MELVILTNPVYYCPVNASVNFKLINQSDANTNPLGI